MNSEKKTVVRLKQTKEEIYGEIGELRNKIIGMKEQIKLSEYQIELYQEQLKKGDYYK